MTCDLLQWAAALGREAGAVAGQSVNPAARSTGLLQELAELREELLETRVATVPAASPPGSIRTGREPDRIYGLVLAPKLGCFSTSC